MYLISIMMFMRTTITLDDDVARKVKEMIQLSGKSSREVYNGLLRSALLQPKKTTAHAPFHLHVFQGRQGLQPGFSWDLSLAETLNQLDELEFKK